jgi:hypothetical protein
LFRRSRPCCPISAMRDCPDCGMHVDGLECPRCSGPEVKAEAARWVAHERWRDRPPIPDHILHQFRDIIAKAREAPKAKPITRLEDE